MMPEGKGGRPGRFVDSVGEGHFDQFFKFEGPAADHGERNLMLLELARRRKAGEIDGEAYAAAVKALDARPL